MIQLGLRGTKADFPWSMKPAIESGLNIAPGPKLSPGFGESTRSRVFHLSMPSGAGRKDTRMENIFARCAGLDVHKESVEACVRRIEPNGPVHTETRHWGTMTRVPSRTFFGDGKGNFAPGRLFMALADVSETVSNGTISNERRPSALDDFRGD